jgi:peptidoglycan/LPS O-acetylase OafA/YrhL
MAARAESVPKHRFLELDALRGVAALLVVYFHVLGDCAKRAGGTGHEYAVFHLLDWGKVGVAAFFCISGFVIPYSFRTGSRHPAQAFAISRVARLYPAYWCSIAVAIAGSYWTGHGWKPALTVAANVTMLQSLVGQPDIIGIYWTLFIELMFYGMCLAAYLSGLLHSSWSLFAGSMSCLALAAAATALHQPSIVPLMALSLMLLACLWRRVIVDGDRQAGKLIPSGAGAFLVLLPYLAYNVEPDDAIRLAASWVMGMALFVLATKVRFKVPQPLLWLGQLSYAIYLYHQLVASRVTQFLPPSGHSPHLIFAATGLGAIGVAAVSYYAIEAPCIRLGRSFGRRDEAGVQVRIANEPAPLEGRS